MDSSSEPVTVGENAPGEIDTGLEYADGEPVVVRVRTRGRRVDLDDSGAAVALAGKPDGWLDAVEEVVSAEGFNVNRRGVVFVPVVTGRDIDDLANRLARTSRTVYLTLLDPSPESWRTA